MLLLFFDVVVTVVVVALAFILIKEAAAAMHVETHTELEGKHNSQFKKAFCGMTISVKKKMKPSSNFPHSLLNHFNLFLHPMKKPICVPIT